MNIDKPRVYKQLLQKVILEEKEAIKAKKWTELAKIKVKKKVFEDKIKEIEVKNKGR